MILKSFVFLILFLLISSIFSSESETKIDLYSGDWQLSINDSIKGLIQLPYIDYNKNRLSIKKSFSLEDSTLDAVFFQSDGFYGNASIYINDNLIYEQKNTSSPIRVQVLKDYLNLSTENLIEIKLTYNNSGLNNFPRFTQTYTPYYPTGVSRPMEIIITKEKPFSDFNYTLEKKNGRWLLKYTLNLNRKFFLNLNREGLRVSEKISSPAGEILSERLLNINNTSGQKIERSITLNEKYLWSAKNPVLLNFEFQVKRYDNSLAKLDINQGLRKATVTKERLFLNSEQITIKGINYHPEFLTDKQRIVSDLKMIKKMGFNAVRFPNLIPDENYFFIADTLGLLLFCDFPIKRYPADLFDDALLQLSRRSAEMAISSLIKHPSFFAFGLGQEVNLNDPFVQKFFIIFNRAIKNEYFLTYLSTLPLPFKTTEIAADFYMIDHYNSSSEIFDKLEQLGIPYILDGRAGIAVERSSGTGPQTTLLNVIFDLKDILNLQGGFLESFNDWEVKFKSLNSKAYKGTFKVQSGLVDSLGIPLPWVAAMEKNIWDHQKVDFYNEQKENRGNNFFSIIMFFGFLIFFFFYRRYPRFREHYSRALRHTYGFFVDMRERRIIPIFISTSTGLHNALIASVFLGSFIYYWRDSVMTHEILSLLFTNPHLHASILQIIQSVWLIVIALWFIFFMHPVVVGTVLKIISFISPVRIRYRQAIVIGFWSAAPFIFFLPISLAAIHLLYDSTYTLYMLIIFFIFILWTHVRLINGIRILFVVRTPTVISLMLLSYIVPVAIFLGFYNPVPNWFDYLSLLINSGYLF